MLVFKNSTVSQVVFHNSSFCSLFLTFIKFCQLWLDRQSVDLKSDLTALRWKLTLGLNTKLSFASFYPLVLWLNINSGWLGQLSCALMIRLPIQPAAHIGICVSVLVGQQWLSIIHPYARIEGHWWHCRSDISHSYPRNLKQLHEDVLFPYLRRFCY